MPTALAEFLLWHWLPTALYGLLAAGIGYYARGLVDQARRNANR